MVRTVEFTVLPRPHFPANYLDAGARPTNSDLHPAASLHSLQSLDSWIKTPVRVRRHALNSAAGGNPLAQIT